jgi:hypothetical protein
LASALRDDAVLLYSKLSDSWAGKADGSEEREAADVDERRCPHAKIACERRCRDNSNRTETETQRWSNASESKAAWDQAGNAHEEKGKISIALFSRRSRDEKGYEGWAEALITTGTTFRP